MSSCLRGLSYLGFAPEQTRTRNEGLTSVDLGSKDSVLRPVATPSPRAAR